MCNGNKLIRSIMGVNDHNELLLCGKNWIMNEPTLDDGIETYSRNTILNNDNGGRYYFLFEDDIPNTIFCYLYAKATINKLVLRFEEIKTITW